MVLLAEAMRLPAPASAKEIKVKTKSAWQKKSKSAKCALVGALILFLGNAYPDAMSLTIKWRMYA